jgi:hypothetical protein
VARVALTVQAPTRAGLNATYTTSMTAGAGNGVRYAYTGREALHVKNDSGGALTLTIKSALTVDGLAVADRTVTVPAGGARFVLPGTADVCKQTSGEVYIEFDVVTSISVAAVAL